MKNTSEWKPTRIKYHKGKFVVNSAEVAPSSLYTMLEAFRVLDLTKSYLRGHLLDLGCGKVPYYEWYKNCVQEITCMDWSNSLHDSKYIDILPI